jgi:hypothetical protein
MRSYQNKMYFIFQQGNNFWIIIHNFMTVWDSKKILPLYKNHLLFVHRS